MKVKLIWCTENTLTCTDGSYGDDHKYHQFIGNTEWEEITNAEWPDLYEAVYDFNTKINKYSKEHILLLRMPEG